MSSLARLSRWSSDHHGVVTLDRLRALGITARQVRTLCEHGALLRVQQAVFVVAAAPTGDLQRIAIACTATSGAASVTTASRVWLYRGVPVDRWLHITVPYGRAVHVDKLDRVLVHRSRALPPCDVVRRRDGIVVTSPPRTLFDLAAVVESDVLESIVEQGIDRRMFTVPTLWGIARRLAGPGRAGSTRFVDVLASRPAWTKPSGSGDEIALEQALVAAGLPRPVRQCTLRLPNGRDVHPDLAWPDLRLAIEVDHVTWHGGRLDSTYDKWRDRQVRLLGWEVDRVTDTDIHRQRETTVRDLVRLYEQRRLVVGL